MAKKKLALFLAILTVVGSMASCAQDEPDTKKTDESGDTEQQNATDGESAEESEAESPIPPRNFNGYTFRFLNGNTSYEHNELIIEEETADLIDNSFYLRNAKVSEYFDITLSEKISNSPQADYSQSVLSDDYSFDVATLRMEWAFPVVVENQAVNWAQIPNIDLTQDYWVQDSVKTFSLMNNVYFAVSAFDITHYDSVRAFAFNKALIEEYRLESPYDLVREGKWTLDKLMEMAMTVANDADGDGKWTTDDMYGVSSSSNIFINTLMTGIDSVLSISKDENDLPYFNLEEEYYVNRIQRVSELMKERSNGLIPTVNNDNNFISGHTLFLCSLICGISNCREMEDEFGIIPTPKWDEEQEEYINLGGSPFFMVVPIVSDNLDRTGAIMEGLAYYSVGIIDEAYYERLLKGRTSRDVESTDMVDLIFSTLKYYHPLANSYLNAPMADDLIWNSSTRISSYFAAVRKKINKEIDEALETYYANAGIEAETAS